MFELNEKNFFGLDVVADWICELENTNSRKDKERTLEKALMAAKLGSASAQCFLYNCYQAYNPYYTFNVKQVPETVDLDHKDNPWPLFWALLEDLRSLTITGYAARDKIEDLSQRFDSLQWNTVCARVIRKDLRCGISITTLNKILKNTEWSIPEFKCQLAKDSASRQDHLIGNNRLEYKLDGVRVIAVVVGPSVKLYSRNGKQFTNFPQIEEDIIRNRSAFRVGQLQGQFVLDGEIMGESFQSLMRQARRKSDVNTENMVYNIFDVMPFSSFQEGHYNAPLHKRIEWLDNIRKNLTPDTNHLQIIDGINVDLDTTHGKTILNRYAKEAIDKKYEGIMIKRLDAPYECKRNDFWLKWKPTITVDLKVVALEEGTGRNLGRLGALVCNGVDDGKEITVNVGSGLSDADRQDFWDNKDTVIGHVVEVQADAVTQNQDGTYSLRFPRFLRFRGFEAGEKI